MTNYHFNNKRLGMNFEKRFCEMLRERGYWVHFLSSDTHGAQPFDVIAGKNGEIYAFDCKTCVREYFFYSRLEENQKMAFELFIERGNSNAFLAVEYAEKVYIIGYEYLKKQGKVKLTGGEYCEI